MTVAAALLALLGWLCGYPVIVPAVIPFAVIMIGFVLNVIDDIQGTRSGVYGPRARRRRGPKPVPVPRGKERPEPAPAPLSRPDELAARRAAKRAAARPPAATGTE